MDLGRKDEDEGEGEVKFFWQSTYYNYLQVCAKHGTFTITDPVQLVWIKIAENKAILEPRSDRILSSRASIAIDYKRNIRSLPLVVKWFFDRPKPSPNSNYRREEFDSPY